MAHIDGSQASPDMRCVSFGLDYFEGRGIEILLGNKLTNIVHRPLLASAIGRILDVSA